MKRLLPYAAGVCLLAVLLMAWQGYADRLRSRYDADAERVLAMAEAERERADSLEAVAYRASERAAAQEARADSIARANRARIARVDTVTVPAEAVPYTAPRDTIIRELLAENGALRGALADEHTAANALRQANAGLRVANDSLAAVLERRPRARWWVPEITLGAHAGVDALHGYRPTVGPSVQIGWKLKL